MLCRMGAAGGAWWRVERGLALALCIAAFGLSVHAAWICARSHHALPVADQWGVVVDLDRWDRGEYRLGDLWKQHNEHRWLVPRLLFAIDLALLRGRNVISQAAVPLAQLAHATLLVLLLALAVRAPPHRTAGAAAAVVALLFSAAQVENLELPLGFAFVFTGLAASAGFAGLERVAAASRRGERGVGAWAATLGWAAAASFSMANGLVVWPVLLLLGLWLRLPRGALGVLAGAGALVVAAYLWGYARPPGHGELLSALASPGRLLGYLAALFGSPFRAFGLAGAQVLGAVGLAAAAGLGLRVVRRGPGARPGEGTLAALLLFAVGSGAMVALGRAGQPLEQAFESRYATFSLWLWAGAAALGHLALASRRAAPSWAPAALLLALLLLLGATLPLQREASREVAARRPALDRAALALRVGVDDPGAVVRIHPRPAKVFRLTPVLRRRQLSVFAAPSPLGRSIGREYRVSPTLRCVGAIARVEAAGQGERRGLRVAGWAWDATRQAAPDRLLLTDAEGVVVGLAATLDAAGARQRGRGEWFGYAIGASASDLRAWLLGADGHSVCPLPAGARAPQ
jgi:hypothetical protein